MANDIVDSSIWPSENPSSMKTGLIDAGDFECNICFELAEDPILTLCGHLFCWPCLYKWLHFHSHSHECPVCKALIEQEKLVPLYGRGNKHTDPRSKPIPSLEIPHRPAGQRPATAPTNLGFGGVMPMASARFGNFAISGGIGGLFSSLLDAHVHGLPNPLPYGAGSVYAHGFSGGFHWGHHDFFHPRRGREENNNFLKTFLLMFGLFMILAMIL